ncbi:MAG: hypothetical protein ACRYFS_02215 [Janthinobacterium lividum]
MQHTQAKDVIQEMHWANLTPPANSLYLPQGVSQVAAQPGSNALLVQATVGGYVQVRKIVEMLDVKGYTFAPTLTFLRLPSGDKHFNWVDGPTQDLEVGILADGTKAFQEITKAGITSKKIKLYSRSVYDPIQLVIDTPRLNPDGSLTLNFTTTSWDGFPVQISSIHRGDVLAVRGKSFSSVTLIQVDY